MEFDPNAYLDAPIEKPLERRPPLMPSDYTGVISDIVGRSWQSSSKYDDLTGQLKSGLAFDLKIALEIPEAERTRCSITSDSFTITDSIMVDLTSTKAIDDAPGRNARLRMYREAADMNKPGETFRPRALIGKAVRVKIGHRVLPSGDPTEEVKQVAKL